MLNNFGVKLAVAETEFKRRLAEFIYKENGEVNIISMIIILAIAIALAIAFRKEIKILFDNIWTNVNQDVSGALGTYK